MRFLITVLLLSILITFDSISQSSDPNLIALEQELHDLRDKENEVIEKIDIIKLSDQIDLLKEVGLPSSSYYSNHAFLFNYNEKHEQANWVAHVISPDIITGKIKRTNDFRTDPLVTTGTSEEKDYFLKSPSKDAEFTYDGFGYDRGHLAPSADFGWSKLATSESYLYSNMSPMTEEFNRSFWVELESLFRFYVVNKNSPLIMVTGPLLTDDLPKIERSTNGVSIPSYFYKAAYDPKSKKTIGFLMPQNYEDTRLEIYAMDIDELESIINLDLFPNIDESLESDYNIADWIETFSRSSVEPIPFNSLPRNSYNTISGTKASGKKIKVCGTIVSARYSNSGNAWLNIDRAYPDAYFSVMIKKKDLINFSYDPVSQLKNTQVCATGETYKQGENTTMKVKNEKSIKDFIPRS